jgi:hypothetical protein
MDSEELKITQAACDIVNDAKYKKRICTVGTTSMRAVESSVSSHGTLNPLMVGQINSFSLLMNLHSYLHDYKLSYAKIYFINDGICILWT